MRLLTGILWLVAGPRNGLGARSAPKDTVLTSRGALPGYQGQSPWLVRGSTYVNVMIAAGTRLAQYEILEVDFLEYALDSDEADAP